MTKPNIPPRKNTTTMILRIVFSILFSILLQLGGLITEHASNRQTCHQLQNPIWIICVKRLPLCSHAASQN
jgi:hypothetical protein